MASSVFKRVILGKDENGLDISDRISSLRFLQSIKKDDALELVALSQDAEYLLELDELTEGRSIIVNFGYIGGEVSPTFKATITDIEPDYDNGGTRLSIKCGDRGRAMRKIRSKKIWKKKTTAQIFKEIADSHGLGLVVEVPVGGFIEWASLPQSSMNDLDFIMTLAAKEKAGNYIAFVSGNDLHLVTRKLDEKSKHTIIVGEYDKLLGFSIKHRETTSPSAAGEVGAMVHDTNSGKAISGKVNAATATAKIEISNNANTNGTAWIDNNGKRVPLIASDTHLTKEGQGVFGKNNASINNGRSQKSNRVKNSNDQSGNVYAPNEGQNLLTAGMEMFNAGAKPQEEIVNEATSAHKSASLKVITASLKEEGNPSRTMNTIITVGGIATRYLGNWLIESVAHDVGSEFTTSCELVKDGVNNGANGLSTKNKKNLEANKIKDDKLVIPINNNGTNGKAYEVNSVTGDRKEFTYSSARENNQITKPAASNKGRYNKIK